LSVKGMDIFQAFVLFNHHGISFLRAIAERSAYDVASVGISLYTAKTTLSLPMFFSALLIPHVSNATVSPWLNNAVLASSIYWWLISQRSSLKLVVQRGSGGDELCR